LTTSDAASAPVTAAADPAPGARSEASRSQSSPTRNAA